MSYYFHIVFISQNSYFFIIKNTSKTQKLINSKIAAQTCLQKRKLLKAVSEHNKGKGN